MAKRDDFYGWGDFGDGDMAEVYGALAGGGLSTAVAVGSRMFGNDVMKKYSEGIGAAAGVLAGAAMYFGTNHKTAGKTAAVVALVTGGLRQLEAAISGPVTFGLPTIAPTVAWKGFGLPSVENTVAFGGAPQLVGPPQLVGADHGVGSTPGAQQVRLNGGPSISGLAGAYGATLFG